ncbi:hypothetical protein BREVNS_0870 [Brevinematales bacterium NS]|nr:hypothetical protein BREVNS_0870 [Brevinematales bacterium NS]
MKGEELFLMEMSSLGVFPQGGEVDTPPLSGYNNMTLTFWRL